MSIKPFFDKPEQSSFTVEYDDLLKTAKVDSVNYYPRGGYLFVFSSNDKTFNSRDLHQKGFIVNTSNFHEFSIKSPSGAVFNLSK